MNYHFDKTSGYADKILAVAYVPNVAAAAFGSVDEKYQH